MNSEENQAQEKPGRRVEITTRDIDTLRFIGEQYAIRLDQLRVILARHAEAGQGTHRPQTPGRLTESAMRVWVRRMKQIGAIEHLLIYHNEPGYVWLTAYGLVLAGLDFRPMTPKPSTLHHVYWCNQARLYIAQRRPSDVWRSERYLRQDHAQATSSKSSGSHRMIEVPDALVISPEGRLIAVEVELTDKQQIRLNGLIRRRAATYHTTWYFCSTQTYTIVMKARAQLEPEVQQHLIIYALDILQQPVE